MAEGRPTRHRVYNSGAIFNDKVRENLVDSLKMIDDRINQLEHSPKMSDRDYRDSINGYRRHYKQLIGLEKYNSTLKSNKDIAGLALNILDSYDKARELVELYDKLPLSEQIHDKTGFKKAMDVLLRQINEYYQLQKHTGLNLDKDVAKVFAANMGTLQNIHQFATQEAQAGIKGIKAANKTTHGGNALVAEKKIAQWFSGLNKSDFEQHPLTTTIYGKNFIPARSLLSWISTQGSAKKRATRKQAKKLNTSNPVEVAATVMGMSILGESAGKLLALPPPKHPLTPPPQNLLPKSVVDSIEKFIPPVGS
jgi:hypothetical protein